MLKKALYVLKQVPHTWYTQIDSYFIENDVNRSKTKSTHVKRKGGFKIVIVAFILMICFLLEMIKS